LNLPARRTFWTAAASEVRRRFCTAENFSGEIDFHALESAVVAALCRRNP